jgi:hypothetical protein
LAAQRGEVYSLAVVITVIGLVLLAWLSFRRAQREWAIGLITSMGGRVHVDKRSKGRPVIAVDLGERAISDAALVYLKKFKDLQAVDLHDTDITDAGLIYLYQLSSLQEVDLHNTQVSEAGIDKLRKMMPRVKIHGWDSQHIEATDRV